MKKILSLITISLCYFSSPALSDSNDDMLFDVASELNSDLPMRVDEMTTWDSSMYLKNENLFVYIYTILDEYRSSEYDSSSLKVFFNQVINKFCTDPDTRYLLGLTDIQMKYFNLNGEYLFKNDFSEDDC